MSFYKGYLLLSITWLGRYLVKFGGLSDLAFEKSKLFFGLYPLLSLFQIVTLMILSWNLVNLSESKLRFVSWIPIVISLYRASSLTYLGIRDWILFVEIAFLFIGYLNWQGLGTVYTNLLVIIGAILVGIGLLRDQETRNTVAFNVQSKKLATDGLHIFVGLSCKPCLDLINASNFPNQRSVHFHLLAHSSEGITTMLKQKWFFEARYAGEVKKMFTGLANVKLQTPDQVASVALAQGFKLNLTDALFDKEFLQDYDAFQDLGVTYTPVAFFVDRGKVIPVPQRLLECLR